MNNNSKYSKWLINDMKVFDPYVILAVSVFASIAEEKLSIRNFCIRKQVKSRNYSDLALRLWRQRLEYKCRSIIIR